MSYTVLLFFDPQTEKNVRSIWQQVADVTGNRTLVDRPIRPHISLAAYQSIDLSRCPNCLQSFSEMIHSMPISFQYIGFFAAATPTLFIGPTVTRPLVDLHEGIYEVMKEYTEGPFDYYHPDRWVPHTTIGIELNKSDLQKLITNDLHIALPLDGYITEIGLLEYLPITQLLSYPLKES